MVCLIVDEDYDYHGEGTTTSNPGDDSSDESIQIDATTCDVEIIEDSGKNN